MVRGFMGLDALEDVACPLLHCPDRQGERWLDAAAARHWLQQFRADPQLVTTLRQMLSRESTAFGIHLAGDDGVLDHAVRMLSSGLWHVHGKKSASSASTDAEVEWKRAPGTAPLRAPSRRSWQLKSRFVDLVVIRAVDLSPGEEFVERPAFTRTEAAGWAYHRESQSAVAEICSTIHGDTPANGRIGAEGIQKVQSAFEKRLLVLVRPTLDLRGQSAPEEAAQSAPPEKNQAPPTRKAPAKTWFSMQLLDEDGEPMANEDYEVVDTTGTLRKGKLDANGGLYIPPMLPEGDCSINFPKIHLNPRKRK